MKTENEVQAAKQESFTEATFKDSFGRTICSVVVKDKELYYGTVKRHNKALDIRKLVRAIYSAEEILIAFVLGSVIAGCERQFVRRYKAIGTEYVRGTDKIAVSLYSGEISEYTGQPITLRILQFKEIQVSQ